MTPTVTSSGYDPYDSFDTRRWFYDFGVGEGQPMQYVDAEHFIAGQRNPKLCRAYFGDPWRPAVATRPRNPDDWIVAPRADMNDPVSGFGS